MIEIKRLDAGHAELWITAVSEIISAEERDGQLISLKEAKTTLQDDRCYLLVALEAGEPVGLLNVYRHP